MLKGKCLKQYGLYYGEIKVVSRADLHGTCEHPKLASKIEKTVAPASCASVPKLVGGTFPDK